jgi:AcrR family transcriptional regulator
MGAGRPTALTPELVAKAEELAKDGLPIRQIATGLGIHERTVYRWLKEADELGENSLQYRFCQSIFKAYDKIGTGHLRNIHEQSANGSTYAATWFLTHHPRFRDDFSDAAAVRREVNSVLSTVTQVIRQSSLTPEQQNQLALLMQAAGLGAAA